MSARGRERKRRIRAVEADLMEAEQAIALALSRVRRIRLPEDDEPEDRPVPQGEPPGLTHH